MAPAKPVLPWPLIVQIVLVIGAAGAVIEQHREVLVRLNVLEAEMIALRQEVTRIEILHEEKK